MKNFVFFFEEKVCCVLCPQGIVGWIFHCVRNVITLDSILPSLFRTQMRESSSSLQIMGTNQKKGKGEIQVREQCCLNPGLLKAFFVQP